MIFPFGKFKGWHIREVPADYLDWIAKTTRDSLVEYEAELKRREDAAEASLSMMQQVIQAGFRAIALKVHPDHGGDTKKMQELNAAVEGLRERVREE